MARRRTEELLAQLRLDDVADRLVRTFSGGMRRRLDLAASLVASPPVLFLDEPTTGLDPQSRNDLWELLRDLVREGTTVVLTTQYLEEADRLADQIVLLDHGRVAAAGSPAELKARIGDERIVVTVEHAGDLATAAGTLARFGDGAASEDPDERQVTISTRPGTRLIEVVRALDAAGVDAVDVHRREATLDDVFLAITTAPSMPGGRNAMTARLAAPALDPRPANRACATSLLDSLALARRNLEHVRQIPEKLLDVTLQPVMFVLLFAYVFGGVIHVPGGSYREYIIAGVLVQTLAFGIMGPATSIATDLDEGIVDRFRSLPMARSAYLIGHLLAEMASITLGIVVLCLSGLIVGWRIHTDLPHALAGFALLLLFAFAMLLARHAARHHRALAGLGAGRGLRHRLPAHVPREHVRAARRPADGASRVRLVQPDQRRRGATRTLFGNPVATPTIRRGRSSTRC